MLNFVFQILFEHTHQVCDVRCGWIMEIDELLEQAKIYEIVELAALVGTIETLTVSAPNKLSEHTRYYLIQTLV